ncbi:MAG TPA: MFS transporter [Alphaproteobacteria bacterium]|nr:MFS transporter [Alphaproteobacteria bacterium]
MKTPELQTRHMAVELLSAVVRKGKGLEEEFARMMDEQDKISPLDGRDRMFVRLLATTTLRRLGQIDALLKRFLAKPLPDKAAYVTDVLRIAAAQTVFLDTPPHAAVSTAVSLVKDSLFKGFAGLTNAVLHKVARDGAKIAAGQDAAKLNIPDWLLRQWRAEYGADAAEKIALAGLEEAPLDFTVKDDAEQWAEKLESIVMPTGTLRREKSASVPSLPGFEDGAWWVQDLSAALPAALFGDLRGKKAADVCAAPGGKTAQMVLRGADVTAVDISANRVKRLKENLGRLKLPVKVIVSDARVWAEKEQKASYDAILLDAPCSATGTLRRHPDVVCHRTPADVERLNKTQRELLEKMLTLLKPDGVLVYCVCSVLPSEGRAIIDDAVKAGIAERLPLANEVPAELISQAGDLTVLPYFYGDRGGCDGFFAARLKRKG